ncbi:MAG TPA: MerR family DNA-binding protein [Candidatus Acidoferrales bacterium]|nr:MerR family DNA-binding protein [Candidatus Acidoferrales bacterium]
MRSSASADRASAERPLYSGELARLAGISADTLRFYERRRLIPAAPRSAAGYCLFPPHALARVRLIRGALSIGFSAKELAAILGERDSGGAPCHRVRALAAGKLAELETRLRELRAWRGELRKTFAKRDRLLGKTPNGQRAGLLEAYAASHPTRTMRARDARALTGGIHKRERKR